MTSRTLMVVPTLGRRPEFLSLALESIWSQGVEDLDLVLVAPRRTDLEAIADEFGGRLVDDPQRGGQSGALNAGLQAARPDTKYFGWLGDDDLLHPGALRTAICGLERHRDAAMVFGWCDYIDESGAVVFRSQAGKLAARIIGWGPNLIPQPGCLMRYEDVMAVGGIDESRQLAMDLDLFLRLRKRGRLVALPETLASFRWHADSKTVVDEDVSMEESDRIRMHYMSSGAARTYEYLRWPGRWALKMAKRRVDHNVRKRQSAAS